MGDLRERHSGDPGTYVQVLWEEGTRGLSLFRQCRHCTGTCMGKPEWRGGVVALTCRAVVLGELQLCPRSCP